MPERIGDRIKSYRKEAHITQQDLANAVGVSHMTIRRYENNEREPRIEHIKKIADVLGTTLNALTNIETVVCENSVFAGTPEASKQFEMISKLKNSKHGQMLGLFNELNDLGKNKALEQIEMLTKIPEYQKH